MDSYTFAKHVSALEASIYNLNDVVDESDDLSDCDRNILCHVLIRFLNLVSNDRLQVVMK